MRKKGIRNCLLWAAIVIGVRSSAQSPSTEPSFEVATVKPIPRDASHPFRPEHFGPHVNPAGASYLSMTVGNLVEYAYNMKSLEVIGPDWTKHDRFDIEGRFPEGVRQSDDRHMLQTLLRERFRLIFHAEKRELESYALVVGKHGQKLVPSLPDPAAIGAVDSLGSENSDVMHGLAKPPKKNADGSITIDRGAEGTQKVKVDNENGIRHFEDSKMTIHDLAALLVMCVDSSNHKVVDETGIMGNYQIAYDCPMAKPPLRISSGDASELPDDPPASYALTRSLDVLGLKLEKRKLLQDVYVIDHVEKPSEN